MALSDLQKASITKRLTEYCRPDPRPEVHRQLRYGFAIGASEVVFFEERPDFRRKSEWLRHDIAKFRWVHSRREWRLYCQFSDLKWRAFEPKPVAPTFEALLAEVEADRTCIFFG